MTILGKRYSLFFLFFIFLSCSSDKHNEDDIPVIPVIPVISGYTMGTTYTVKYLTDIEDNEEVLKNKNTIENILKEINMEMSTYIVDSEISQFNSMQNTDWMPISEDFAFVVQSSFKYHKISNGLYLGISVLQPVPIPLVPLIRIIGNNGTKRSGSILNPSSFK